MPEETHNLRYMLPPSAKENTSVIEMRNAFLPIAQFVGDWEILNKVLSENGLKDVAFPASLEKMKNITFEPETSNQIELGDGQFFTIDIVPGIIEEEKIKNFKYIGSGVFSLKKPRIISNLMTDNFSLRAPMIFNPNPLEISLSDIRVNQSFSGKTYGGHTLESYLKEEENIDTSKLGNVSLYSAVIFVPISSSKEPEKQYITQIVARADSMRSQIYQPVLQEVAYTGILFDREHNGAPIEMIKDLKKGSYWKVDPIDIFGEYGKEMFGDNTGRLIIVSLPQKEKQIQHKFLSRGDSFGGATKGGGFDRLSFGSFGFNSLSASETHISEGGDTDTRYGEGQADIDYTRNMKALSVRTIGIRVDSDNKFKLENVIPYLIKQN